MTMGEVSAVVREPVGPSLAEYLGPTHIHATFRLDWYADLGALESHVSVCLSTENEEYFNNQTVHWAMYG